MFLLKELIENEGGQSLVEYALIVGFISIAAIVAIKDFGIGVKTLWTNIIEGIEAIL